MAATWRWMVGVLLVAGEAAAAEPVVLREKARPGQTTHVLMELKAQGKVLEAAEPPAKEPQALALKVEGRFEFVERILKAGPDGAATRAVRRVRQAAAALNGDVLPTSPALRPEVAMLVAERRDEGVVSFSPGGPLTRAELEVTQFPGDPLTLAGLLPSKPVAVGERWSVSNEAARSLSGYDALASNALVATLEACDDASARVLLKGQIRGAALGAEGTVGCDGSFTFDRKAGRIDGLTLDRTEARKPGAVEMGLDLTSTLTVARRPAEAPPELSDAALAGLSLEPRPGLELLLYSPPDGSCSLLHGRDWHISMEGGRRAVLKRIDHGEVVAGCVLAIGPKVGRGRHQDLGQFRDDIRAGLGRDFGRFLDEGEVESPVEDGFCYRVVVQGQVGGAEIRWIYYLVASPEGDQLVASFAMRGGQVQSFADQDLRMIGSIAWKAATTPTKPN